LLRNAHKLVESQKGKCLVKRDIMARKMRAVLSIAGGDERENSCARTGPPGTPYTYTARWGPE